ncbi:MAG: RNA-binding cell elongation regulator Jag/EloR [Lachnospiraceae bacterium]
MEYQEFTGKTVSDAITNALVVLETTSDNIEYEVVSKGSSGVFGIGSKPAKIKARLKEQPKKSIEDIVIEFLGKVFDAMELTVKIDVQVNEDNVNINLIGDDMGILIGKRGQTLDSLQYLVSLVVNKYSENYMRVKVDTENYRERRKATLENLAKNIAFKVKRTKRAVSLEPMNPFERRIIHSALQNDKYVTTKSEGEEPYRHVVVLLKKN